MRPLEDDTYGVDVERVDPGWIAAFIISGAASLTKCLICLGPNIG